MTNMRDMVRIEGGEFFLGSEAFYPEEAPVVTARVRSFDIDRTAVTNAQFAEFVDATGYVTVAERPLDPADFPGADLASLEPGSLVFVPTSGPVDLTDWRAWWQWMPGANWRHPFGPDSDILNKSDHPVVQVSFEDAAAYAEWASARLPTEAEWEFAARGGLDGATFAWGDEPHAPGALLANTWQGRFPYENTRANGWLGTAPVGSFPPNGYGLFDMTGNTWEWTTEPWTPRHSEQAPAEAEQGCGCGCGPSGKPTLAAQSVAKQQATVQDAVAEASAKQGDGPVPPAAARKLVLKGGSHLCAPEYCLRYRPAARSPQDADSAATHIGFRCVRSVTA